MQRLQGKRRSCCLFSLWGRRGLAGAGRCLQRGIGSLLRNDKNQDMFLQLKLKTNISDEGAGACPQRGIGSPLGNDKNQMCLQLKANIPTIMVFGSVDVTRQVLWTLLLEIVKVKCVLLSRDLIKQMTLEKIGSYKQLRYKCHDLSCKMTCQ